MKQVMVVGGAGGLGKAIVEQLPKHGYTPVVAGRARSADPRTRHSYPIDPTRADWRSLYLAIERETAAPIHALIFVAGSAVFGQTALIPVERAREVFELNFWACAAAAEAIARHWEGKQEPGRFVAISSIVARRAVPFEAYYAASKAATTRFLECLQLEYGHKKIEFVSVFPGMLNTAFRRRAEWYGMTPPAADTGADVKKTADAVVRLLKGRPRSRVVGWRESCIDLADRFLPGVYDRTVLYHRVQRMLK